jgi:hypothetical protein
MASERLRRAERTGHSTWHWDVPLVPYPPLRRPAGGGSGWRRPRQHPPYRLFTGHPDVPGGLGVLLPGSVVRSGAAMLAAHVPPGAGTEGAEPILRCALGDDVGLVTRVILTSGNEACGSFVRKRTSLTGIRTGGARQLQPAHMESGPSGTRPHWPEPGLARPCVPGTTPRGCVPGPRRCGLPPCRSASPAWGTAGPVSRRRTRVRAPKVASRHGRIPGYAR